MKVSVIVPCYNAENFVRILVKNLLDQTYDNIEIVLVDDCSKDNTKKIIQELAKKYPNKIVPVYSEKNNWAGGARSEGLKISTGDYVTFIDCDDFFDKDYIEKLIYEIKKNSKLDIVISGFRKVYYDKNNDLKVKYERKYKNSIKALWHSFTTWGKLYRRDWLIENELYIAYGHVFEDTMFHGAIILNSPNCALADTLGYNYLYNPKSVSHTTMNTFVEGSIELENEYLIGLKKYAKTQEKEEILVYFAFLTMCWHLLKSGCNVGKEAMLKEYDKAFLYLESEFPSFKSNKLISIFHKNNDRFIIRIILWFIRILYKIKLSRLFFSIYGRMNLQKLWPNM